MLEWTNVVGSNQPISMGNLNNNQQQQPTTTNNLSLQHTLPNVQILLSKERNG
jgi:hypothetical protein